MMKRWSASFFFLYSEGRNGFCEIETEICFVAVEILAVKGRSAVALVLMGVREANGASGARRWVCAFDGKSCNEVEVRWSRDKLTDRLSDLREKLGKRWRSSRYTGEMGFK
ncbi:hypothetical protein P3X46_018350 [Hevea brasiliensis]|uniref:Leucine-rich repeat-containing N-terminal plant-type domain-containing protein n=1 Tax=Hevea brasiliensis TaxID=3981 RepID=A0ABQ9LUG2_HEVBR|nr:hypothetical protein P3X46_018350 [Hevea brasiliensis]